MRVHGLSHAVTGAACHVIGVNGLKWLRQAQDEVSGLSRFVRRHLAMARPGAGRRGDPPRAIGLARSASGRERYERLRILVTEDMARRDSWLRQSRQAVRQLGEILGSGRDPAPADRPAVGTGARPTQSASRTDVGGSAPSHPGPLPQGEREMFGPLSPGGRGSG